jgi:ATP-dependent RNA helicase RhlE
VLVFCGTRIGANRLAHQLRKDHIHTDAIHGDKTQAEREAALEAFKTGRTSVLVATDVASRGLDIAGLPQVINFDIPHSPEDYVHRIGRTGRAGLTGEAISLVAPEDAEALADIEKLIKKKLERVLVAGYEPSSGAVATMIGGERRRDPRPQERPSRHQRGEGRPPRREDRPSQPQHRPAPSRPSDPIFSRPYEPDAAPAAPKAPEPAASPSKRRERPVAALLGGLKRA